MFENREYFTRHGWSTTYLTVGNDRGKHNIGSGGKELVEYISKEYPEYFDEFCDKFDSKLPVILEQIKQEEMKIDFNRLTNKLAEKRRFLMKLRNRGERGYDE